MSLCRSAAGCRACTQAAVGPSSGGQRTDTVLRTRLCCCRGEQALRGGCRVRRCPPAEGAQKDLWKDDLHHFLQGSYTELLHLQSSSQHTSSPVLNCWQENSQNFLAKTSTGLEVNR